MQLASSSELDRRFWTRIRRLREVHPAQTEGLQMKMVAPLSARQFNNFRNIFPPTTMPSLRKTIQIRYTSVIEDKQLVQNAQFVRTHRLLLIF